MKRLMSSLLVVGMVTAMLAAVAGGASAQTADPSGQITVVNGTDVTVKAVTSDADGTTIDLGTGIAPGATGTPTILLPGSYTINFIDDADATVANYTVPLEAVAIWNVVSGYASPSDAIDPSANNAIAYTVHDESTPAVTVANSSAVDVTVMPAGTAVPQGNLVEMPNTDAFQITSPGSSVDVTPSGGDASYTMFVAVGPDDALSVATVAIDDLAALRTKLAGSVGPVEVEVPDVVGQAEADATSAITGAGLVAGRSEAPSDDVPAGSVVSQDPAAGTMVGDGSTVNIVVSTGPPPPVVVPVPDVVGQAVADATITLEGEGFVVETTEEQSETVEAGLVISMNPAAGTEVAEGTTVALTVSSGQGDVVVPDFSGMTISEATESAEAAGLSITFVQDPDDPDPEGIVVSQDPAEGSTVEAGSEVVAQLSPAFADAWTILVVDSERELTVTGINFTPNTTPLSTVLDTTIAQTAAVGDTGSWTTTIDISSLDDAEHFLLVTGTAQDGSDYSQTFKIPEAGQSTDEPDATSADDGGGLPVWAWILLGILVIALVAVAIKVFGGSTDDNEDASGSIET